MLEQLEGAQDTDVECLDELWPGVHLPRSVGRVEFVLVVDDEQPRGNGLGGAQLRPDLQMPLQIADEVFRGGSAGCFDLGQDAMFFGDHEQIGGSGVCEFFVEVSGGWTGRGEGCFDRGDQGAA